MWGLDSFTGVMFSLRRNLRRTWKNLKRQSMIFYFICLCSVFLFIETLSKMDALLKEGLKNSATLAQLREEREMFNRLMETYSISQKNNAFFKNGKRLELKLSPPKWQQSVMSVSKLNNHEVKHYNLTQILHLRIYEEDKAKLTIKELKQWMHYMFYAGVEHIFLCDHAQRDSELLESQLEKYINLGLLTYKKWPEPKRVVKSKLRCYTHFMNDPMIKSDWQTSVDMDEYPFIVHDQTEGFLARYLRKVPPLVVQILMENYLMLGQGDRTKDMVIERINRRTPKPANKLTKPVYRPANTKPGMHRYSIAAMKRTEMKQYRTIKGNQSEIIMLHYWGARAQNWGPDTQEVLDRTRVFNIMVRKVAPEIRNSLLMFGEKDAFSNETGP